MGVIGYCFWIPMVCGSRAAWIPMLNSTKYNWKATNNSKLQLPQAQVTGVYLLIIAE